MAKKLTTQIKLQIVGGSANPAPPVGPALGQHGLNIQDFCTQFNNATAEDRTFDFIMKVAPTSALIMKAAKIKKGAGNPLKEKVGTLTKAQVRKIAEKKMPDLNANDIEAAMKIIEGTARQMGLTVE